MAFEVILLHRMSWKGYDGLIYRFLKSCELFSVPIFMIIAFYLCANTLEEGNNERIKNRFIRLIIPQIGWAVVCWVVYVITDIVFAHKLSHNLMDLAIAIISGCRQNTNPSTWFQAVLILLTIIYCVIFKIFNKRKAWYVVYLTLVISVFIQQSGIYYDFFENMPYEINNTIGRIFEMMPYAALGLCLRHYQIFEQYIKKRYIVIAVSLFLFTAGFKITFPVFKGFFAGIYPVYMALWLFLIFLFLPFEKISFEIKPRILQLTKYTLGIYCAHRLVYGILDIVYELAEINPGSFLKCILVYITCYIMSYVMCLFPFEVFKKMVD